MMMTSLGNPCEKETCIFFMSCSTYIGSQGHNAEEIESGLEDMKRASASNLTAKSTYSHW